MLSCISLCFLLPSPTSHIACSLVCVFVFLSFMFAHCTSLSCIVCLSLSFAAVRALFLFLSPLTNDPYHWAVFHGFQHQSFYSSLSLPLYFTVIVWQHEICSPSGYKSTLILRKEHALWLHKNLCVVLKGTQIHQDSVEKTDSDGAVN